ncbi:MAG: histidine phosphatase family protein [Pseudomonadota bacterium]
MRLYLIRHAQSANNALWNGTDHVPGRSSDPEITSTGHRQAQQLAEHLSDPNAEPRQHPYKTVDHALFDLTHIYCSLMTRSILTAQYVANQTGLTLHALPDVFEKYGIYEVVDDGAMHGLPGPNKAYFSERFPDLILPHEFNPEGWWSRPAETEEEFVTRVRGCVTRIRQQSFGEEHRVAIVAHGDFIDQFINELMGVKRHAANYHSSDWVANWTFHNTSISRFDFQDDACSVVYLNRVDHLAQDIITW